MKKKIGPRIEPTIMHMKKKIGPIRTAVTLDYEKT